MHIYLAVLNTGWVRWETAFAVTRAMFFKRGVRVTLDYDVGGRSIPVARNLARRKALDAGADCLLMVDSDTYPTRPITPEANPLDLAALDLDYVGIPVPLWRPGVPEPAVVLNVTPLEGDTFDLSGGGMREVRRIGGGWIFVSRRALERVQFRYEFDADGVNVGDEDMHYCDDLRAAGFKVWAACDWLLDHQKTIGLVTVHEEIANRHRVLVE